MPTWSRGLQFQSSLFEEQLDNLLETDAQRATLDVRGLMSLLGAVEEAEVVA